MQNYINNDNDYIEKIIDDKISLMENNKIDLNSEEILDNDNTEIEIDKILIENKNNKLKNENEHNLTKSKWVSMVDL